MAVGVRPQGNAPGGLISRGGRYTSDRPNSLVAVADRHPPKFREVVGIRDDTHSVATASVDDDLKSLWRVIALVAVVLLGLSSLGYRYPYTSVISLAAALLVGMATWLVGTGAMGDESRLRIGAIVAVGAFMVTALPIPNQDYSDSFPGWFRLALGVVVLVAISVRRFHSRFWQVAIGGFLILAVSVGAVLLIDANPDPGTDVIYGYQEAAATLKEGRNPYSDAVYVDSGPAYANKGNIVGYPYPPPTMLLYVAAEWVWDGRLVNVVAMMVVLSLMIWFGSARSSAGLLLLGTALTYPMLGPVYVHGWTEPLQLALLLVAAVTFRRWIIGGLIMGMAVASKQYMVLTLLPLLLLPDPNRWRRLGVVVATGVVVTAPFFLWNPAAFWQATVAVQFERIQRLDTSSVAALGVVLPLLLVLGVVGFAALFLGSRIRGTHGLLLTQVFAVALYFALSPNTFRNYWFLVAFSLIFSISLSGPRADWSFGLVDDGEELVVGADG